MGREHDRPVTSMTSMLNHLCREGIAQTLVESSEKKTILNCRIFEVEVYSCPDMR